MKVPYTLLDYCFPVGPFPRVTHGYYYAPQWSAYKTDDGAYVELDGRCVQSFMSMDDACRFIRAQGSRP